MKKRWIGVALICAIALAAFGAALAEGGVYASGAYYHATPLCAGASFDRAEYARLSAQAAGEGNAAEAAVALLKEYYRQMSVDEATLWGYAPCPVCVSDETDYGEPRAVKRGGTVVLRVPDAWIDAQDTFDVLGTAADEAIGENAWDAAEYLHGEAYAAFVEAAAREGRAEADVLCPSADLGDGALSMHARHIGGAWYLTVRPDRAGRDAPKEAEKLALGLRLEGGALRWDGAALVKANWGLHYEETRNCPLEPLDGSPVFSGDYENLAVTLFRELDANILVIRETPGDAGWLDARLTLDDRLAADGLKGYMDGDDAVYVCVLTDAEAEALSKDAFPRLVHPGRANGRLVEGVAPEIPPEGEYPYTVFFNDGALYIANNADEACRPVSVHVQAEGGDPVLPRRLDCVPLGATALAFDAGEVDYLTGGAGEIYAWADLTLGDGGEVISNCDRVWGAYVDGRWTYAHAPTDAGGDNPGPGRDLSFLSSYVDALQVGDWYLACVAATGEGRYEDATRNETAEWVLLNERGDVLAEGLRWWPEGHDWPLQPRPFEGFEDGVDVAVLRVGNRYGLIDRDGEIVCEPKYDNIFGFLPGDTSTPAERGGRWGCIDAAGNEVVPFVYDCSFSRFEDGCTVVERDGKQGLLGEDGTELLPAAYDVVWLEGNSPCGFAQAGTTALLFNRKWEILFEKEMGEHSWIYCYADAEPPYAYHDGGTEQEGYLTLNGEDVPGGPYEDAAPFWKGAETAVVQVDGKYGAVRRDGSFAVPPDYDWIAGFSGGLYLAQQDGLWGYLDADGNVAIPFAFSHAHGFRNGYADACPAEDADRHGLIDRDGNWVIEPQYALFVAVGEDGVAVGFNSYEDRDHYRLLPEGGAEPVAALGYGDDGEPATLDGAPTLEKRVSDAERLPHLDGAYRLSPLLTAYAQAVYPKDTEVYRGWNSYRDDGNPVLTDSGVASAWERLSEGDADVIFVPAPGPEDPIWATLAARGQVAEFTPLCREAVVFPVNADNPVSDIAASQLRDVFAGRIADWADLGAAQLGPIAAYQGESRGDDGAPEAFERVCAFDGVAEGQQGVTGYDDWDGEVFTGTADYRNLPNAIGYALRTDCRALLDAGAIKLLSVDGVAPTDENLVSGAYPYAETLYAVRLAGNDNPNVLALLEWLQSDQGAELAEKTGYARVE